MRILYLVYSQQQSFDTFINSPMTNWPWVDAFLNEIVGFQDLSVALALPINDKIFRKGQTKEIIVYGLPNPEVKNILKKVYLKLAHAMESAKINAYIRSVMDDFRPDLIQVFGTEYPFGLFVMQSTVPVVLHMQGILMVILKKWFAGTSKWEQFRYAKLKDLVLMYGNLHEFFTFRKRAKREELIIRNCKYFIGRTSFDKRIVSLLSPGSHYFHCNEILRKDFFKSTWDCQQIDQVNCISVLKGTSYKGLDLLIETLAVLKEFSNTSFVFRICGISENEEIVEILKKKYKSHFRYLNINFLGKLSTGDLLNQLCNSNIFVHPSYIENSPNSVCEAMALGMPVISTYTGGVSSLISERFDGLLVQEGDPYSMASAIIELANNYDYAKSLGKNARETATKRHDPDVIYKNLKGIYETIINMHDPIKSL